MLTRMIIALILTFFATTAFAEDAAEKGHGEKSFANSINLHFDWINVPAKGNFFNEGADIYTLWKKKVGIGIDATASSSSSFFDIRPYLTVTNWKLPISAIIGYNAVSTGAQYVDYGIWYTPKIGQVNVFADIRNFSAVSSKANDYLDAFVDLTIPVNDRFSVGIDIEEIHQWNGKSDNLYIGPVIYTKLGTTTLMVRGELEKHWSPGSKQDGFNVRIAYKIPFAAF